MQRLLWFVALWLGGVASVTLVSYVPATVDRTEIDAVTFNQIVTRGRQICRRLTTSARATVAMPADFMVPVIWLG